MTTPSTAWLDAAGKVVAAAKAFDAFAAGKPLAITNAHLGVRAKMDTALDKWATEFGLSRPDLDALIEASAGYTNTGGSGALCT